MHLADVRAGDGRDALGRYAIVDNGVVVAHDVVVDDGGVLVHHSRLVSRNAVTVRPAVAEPVVTHEGEVVPPEAETEADSHTPAVPGQTESGGPATGGRQRSPATIGIRVAPRHPRRRPVVSGNPHPANTVVPVPAAVVERRPTPRIGRVPIPSSVGVEPVSAVAVGLPPGHNRGAGRLPHPPIRWHIHPGPVRRQGRVVVVVYLRYRLRVNRDGLSRRGRQRGWSLGDHGLVGQCRGRLRSRFNRWRGRCRLRRFSLFAGRAAMPEHLRNHVLRDADVLQIQYLVGS